MSKCARSLIYPVAQRLHNAVLATRTVLRTANIDGYKHAHLLVQTR